MDAFVDYFALLRKWNRSIRLTGSTSEIDLKRHTDEAQSLVPVLVKLGDVSRETSPDWALKVIDIGSGGGFPSIPLALRCPTFHFTLVEPIAKKVSFLNTCRRELKLTNIEVIRGRDEGLARQDRRWDVAVSQATFSPSIWLERGMDLIRPGGHVLAMLGPNPGDIPSDTTIIDVSFGDSSRSIGVRTR